MAWHDGPKSRDNPLVTQYILDQGERQAEIASQVRAILAEDDAVLEGIAWGVPCYFRNGPLIYTSCAKTHVTLGFFRGNDIEMGLESTGKSPVGKFTLKLKDEFPEDRFRAWLARAVELDDEGD